ncbi:MAG: VCBS repeat-containing protein [Sedimentisphaerales bacterium]|nr:VCBS repeat-containing protein [Sedimentisphaerales bacterium]
MRTIKCIIILLLLSSVTVGAGKPVKNLDNGLTRADSKQPDSNDIGQYYGFAELEIVKLDYGIQNLQIADFDGDGLNDIVLANNAKSCIELLLQKKQVGPEEEEVAVDPNDLDINALVGPSRFKKQTLPVSQRIYSLVADHLNGDKLTDLAFYGEPRGLYVLLQKPGDRQGAKRKDLAWQPRKRINIDDALPSRNALICADIDNDGRKDLVVAGRKVIYLVLQKDDGQFAEPVKFASAAQILGVDAGDINGDGKTDLIIYTDEQERPIHVRLGQKTNQLGPEIRLFAEFPLAAEPANIDPGQPGGSELVAIDAVSKRLVCYKYVTDTSATGTDGDWQVLFYPLSAGQDSAKRDLVIADCDGDGLSDVVISDPVAAELVFYQQAAGVGLMEPSRFPSLSDTDCLSAADVDGDGAYEVGILSVREKAIGISKFENGRLTFPRAVDLTGEPLAMELADIDGDGSIDCVYAARSQDDARSFRVIYDVKQTRIKPNNIPEIELKRLVANPQGIRVFDVDQDGRKDAIIFVKYELPILVRQVESRKFEVVDSPRAQTSLLKEATPRSIDAADVDGRPGKEVLIAQNNFARSLVFADGGWKVIDQYNAKSPENRISAVAVTHLDEGTKDKPGIFLLDGQKGSLQILKPGADKAYHFDKELDVGTWSLSGGIKMMLASLMNGRGENIVLFDGEKFAVVLSPKDAVSCKFEKMFSYETKIKDGAYGNLATGDINSDGLVDLIMVEFKHNHIEILTLDSSGKPVPAMRFKIFEDKSYRRERPQGTGVEPRELKVADVTGDGAADLVTVIHDRVIIYPQD